MVIKPTESLRQQIQQRVILLSIMAILSTLISVGLTLLVVLLTMQLQLSGASSTIALTFESFLGNIQSDMVATGDALKTAPTYETEMLRELLERQPSIFEVKLVDTQGHVLLQRRRVGLQNIFTLPEQPWLETVQSGQIYVSPVKQVTSGVPVVEVGIAVLDHAGQFSTTLLAQVDLTALWNQVVSFPVGETGYVYITDNEGQLLVYRDLSLLAENLSLRQWVGYTPQTIMGANLWVYRGLARTWVIADGIQLQSAPWFVIVEQPLADLWLPFLIQFIFFTLIALAIGGLVYNIFNFTRYKVVAPLLLLQDGVTLFAQGQLQHTIKLTDHNELGLLATTFNNMTRQLGDFIYNLEQLVQERTQALETSAAVSRQIAMILNIDQLALEVVTLIQTNFHFYYAQIYLLEGSQLVFMAGAASQGEQLEIANESVRHLSMGEGIVGTVAQTGEFLLYNDVTTASMFLYDALLPDTKSELTVPISKHGQIMGVLDIQSKRLNRFSPSEVKLIQSIADQIAIAVENARLYTQLAKTNADKDKFFSIVAHDLKGPFMPLLGNAELLAEFGDTFKPVRVKEMGASMHRSARNAFGLLESLLTWARLQMGRMEYNPQRLDLAEVAAKTVELLSDNAAAKQIKLYSEMPMGTWVYADENMLDTVIRNLTNNALKFTPQGGEVRIGCRELGVRSQELGLRSQELGLRGQELGLRGQELGVRSQELGIRSQESVMAHSQFPIPNFVEVSIADTGVGMPPEVQEKLFKLDQHVTTVGTGKETGTGLGLVICQEMVLKSGGRIWVESEVGKGTMVKFTVRLDGMN